MDIPLYYEELEQPQPWDVRARQALTKPRGRSSRLKQLWYSYFMSSPHRHS